MKLVILILSFVLIAIQVIDADDIEVVERVVDQTQTEYAVEETTSEDTSSRSESNTESAVNEEKTIDSEVRDGRSNDDITANQAPVETRRANLEDAAEANAEKTSAEENATFTEENTAKDMKTGENVTTDLSAENNRQSPDDVRSTSEVDESKASDKVAVGEVETNKSDAALPNLSNIYRNAPISTADQINGTIPTKEQAVTMESNGFNSGAMTRTGMPDAYIGIGARKMIDPKDLILGSSLESARGHHDTRLSVPIVARAISFEPYSAIGSQTQLHYPADLLPTYQTKNLQMPNQFLYSPGSYDAKLRGTASLLNSMGPDTYNSFKSIVPEARFKPNIRSHETHPILDMKQFALDKNSYPFSPNNVDNFGREGKVEFPPLAKKETDNRRQYGAVDPNIGMNFNLYSDLSRYRRSLANRLLPYYMYRFNNYRRDMNHNNYYDWAMPDYRRLAAPRDPAGVYLG